VIYEPHIECCSLEELKKLQAVRLRKYLREVGAAIPEYYERICKVGLNDPVADDDELLSRFAAIDFSDGPSYVKTDQSALRNIDRALYYLETTSGTTSVPKARYVTYKDDLVDQHLVARSFSCFGVTPKDRVLTIDLGELNFYALITKGLARLGVNDSLFYGAKKPFADSVREALSCSPTILVTTPSILARCLPALIADLKTTPSLKKVIYYCEPLDRCFELLLDQLGIESFSLYSAIEVGIIGAECNRHNGIHVWADVVLPSINEGKRLQAEDRSPNNDLHEGSLALTTLLHRGKPTLSYLLGDRVRYTTQRCECGRTLPRIHFLERDNEVLGIFGTKFSYRQIYNCIYGDDVTAGFLQIILHHNSDGTTMTLVLPQCSQSAQQTERLVSKLSSEPGLSYLVDHGVLHFALQFVSPEFFTSRKIPRVKEVHSTPLPVE
jgi:phenylacetate-CoA ligase